MRKVSQFANGEIPPHTRRPSSLEARSPGCRRPAWRKRYPPKQAPQFRSLRSTVEIGPPIGHLGGMKLILWDIDGTLMHAGPVAGEVFSTAVEQAVGDHPGDHGVVMSGKTDPQIALEILETMAVAEEHAHGHLPAILTRLEAELAAAAEILRKDGEVLLGVEALLGRLSREPDVVQTILTGNIAPNAAVKLAAFGLERWFDLTLGAYGSDHRDRCELVPVAIGRFRERYGSEPDEVWVIGDTPRDLECARAGGARCLLVATGRPSFEELAALGADAVTPDLGDTEWCARLLVGEKSC
jgi:phosphoglycolate phosphatase